MPISRDRAHLHAEVTAVRELFHPHAKAMTVHEDMDKLRRRDNGGSEGGVLTLLGASRSGKTRILRAFESMWPEQPRAIVSANGEFADRKEVVSMRMPTTGKKTFFERLLSKLTNMNAAQVKSMGGREYDLGDAVMDMSRKVGMRLLILEEAHQSIENKTPRMAAELATALKDMTNESMFSLVISGTPSARHLIDLSEELSGRVLFEHELPALAWERVADRRMFQDVLRTLDEHLRDNVFGTLSGLAEAGMALPLLRAGQGYIGHAATLIETGGYHAVEDMLDGRSKTLGLQHLVDAFSSSPLARRFDATDGPAFPGSQEQSMHAAEDPVMTRLRGRTRRAGQDVAVKR